jgi:hypothetical protein
MLPKKRESIGLCCYGNQIKKNGWAGDVARTVVWVRVWKRKKRKEEEKTRKNKMRRRKS